MTEPIYKYIPLDNSKFAIVDADLYDSLMKYKWVAVKHQRCWYAKTDIGKNGKHFWISMHRLIANTPSNKVCHHKNFNSLDNRRANLENMTLNEHDNYHRNHTYKVIRHHPECKSCGENKKNTSEIPQ